MSVEKCRLAPWVLKSDPKPDSPINIQAYFGVRIVNPKP